MQWLSLLAVPHINSSLMMRACGSELAGVTLPSCADSGELSVALLRRFINKHNKNTHKQQH